MDDFMIDQSHGDSITMYDRRLGRGSSAVQIRGYESDLYYLSFTLTSWWGESGLSARLIDRYQHIFRYNPKLVTLLGVGYICQNCGEHNTSGTATCWRCGGLVKEEDWICPVHFDFDCTDISAGAVAARDVYKSRFEMVSKSVDIDTLFRAIYTNSTAITLPGGFLIEPGYYLCQFCGQAVHDGAICPGCGGWRMPMSEIIKLDRICKYCGGEVKGGIVCPGCSARIAGTTFKQYLKKSGYVI